jgi:hypothetical protein
MARASDLLRQERGDELWQMCCGFLSLSISEFMEVQNRLMEQQLTLLNNCKLGEKIMRGAKPKTVEEFRRRVPLTTYKDYCPELIEKREDILPAKPEEWVHTSGKSGEYPCKWVPLPAEMRRAISEVSYGLGILSSCKDCNDVSRMTLFPRLIYSVAPRPYMSGAMADMLALQTPIEYLPALEKAEGMSFEDRIKFGFQEALSKGFDFFFGLSLVLVTVGSRFSEASDKSTLLALLGKPRALYRLIKGMVKAKLAGRAILPRDLWTVRGIISSGLDSWVYRERIKELWGRYPLDTYAGTEGAIYATQTWDYDSMTFVPGLNLLEFIPEEEHFKWQLDRSYQPQTLLLNEVKAGENYEVVITNFHGGALIRYRPGDMIRITSLNNDKLGIKLPQMVFERRVDGLLDFVVVRLTEKQIWQAIESTGVAYEDWTAYKQPGNSVLRLFIEPKGKAEVDTAAFSRTMTKKLLYSDDDAYTQSNAHDDLEDMVEFKVETVLLEPGTFARYMAQRQAEGADLAHLKPPHIQPSEETLTLLVTKPERAEAAAETGVDTGIEA